MKRTTLRVCAGLRLELLLRRSDMEKLVAKQTAGNLTDAEAIKQAKDGAAAAFEFLYKAHCRRVYSVCSRMIKNPAEAECLTRQVFLQLFRKIGTFRGESCFSTWLHRVTVNIVLMHLRRKKPTEILAENFERHSSNGEGPREHGSSDTICKSPASVESNPSQSLPLESNGEGEPQDGENSTNFNMRRHLVRCTSLIIFLVLAFVIPQIASAADDDDPPGRVARLSYISGAVSFNPAGTDDWASAVVNRPLTIGDKLWTDNGARAELNLGTAAIRLGDQTGFSFLNLDDLATQIRMTEGALNVRVRRLDQGEVFEIDTPNLAFSILSPGIYRINVNESGDATIVAVQTGEGEVTGGGSAYTVRAGESGMFSGVDQLSADMQGYPGADEFDRWCNERDRRWDRSSAPRYVSDDVIGYEDLDDYGGWRSDPEYGNVWFPRTTVAGWAPYGYGHWVWISPWGWTWVDDEPWGFAPFHYGRWVVVGGAWGWVPSPPRPAIVTAVYVRPVYSPALVAWVGGSRFAVGVGIGSAPVGVAWFPLGPRDVYCPSYHVSQRYVERVNVSNTVVVNRTQVTNVYNNVYVNKTVNVTNVRYQNQGGPNAVTAVSHQAFVAGQPVNRNIVRVDSREVASAPVAPLTPSVAPQAHSVVGAAAPARVRPPAQVMARPVVAKTTPPPAPPAFTRQQQAIQTNGGRPIPRSQERQLEGANQPAAKPNVRMAPPARPVTPSNQPNNNRTNQPNQLAETGARPAHPPSQPERPNAAPPVQPNNRPPAQPNAPANPPANPRREDRPPSARPANPPAVNPQTEQEHQPQADKMRQQQDQERQRLEQKQPQEQQMQQRKQQQREQMQRKPDQQQQQEQKQETQKQQRQQLPPKDKPPH